MTLTPGTQLGPYEVTGAIGAGGMGEVYQARDTRLNRDVAIKVLPASFADDPDRRARFEREAQAVAALSHPNVIAIFDTGIHEGQLYVVMELLTGKTRRVPQGLILDVTSRNRHVIRPIDCGAWAAAVGRKCCRGRAHGGHLRAGADSPRVRRIRAEQR